MPAAVEFAELYAGIYVIMWDGTEFAIGDVITDVIIDNIPLSNRAFQIHEKQRTLKRSKVSVFCFSCSEKGKIYLQPCDFLTNNFSSV